MIVCKCFNMFQLELDKVMEDKQLYKYVTEEIEDLTIEYENDFLKLENKLQLKAFYQIDALKPNYCFYLAENVLDIQIQFSFTKKYLDIKIPLDEFKRKMKEREIAFSKKTS